jgi:putative restriction endonuclease
MSRGALSIKTTMPRAGRQHRYNDIASDDGFFVYRFQGDNPAHSDNRSMRESWEDQSPFIYFHAVAPTVYEAIWPASMSSAIVAVQAAFLLSPGRAPMRRR